MEVTRLRDQLDIMQNSVETSKEAVADIMKILEKSEQKIRKLDSKLNEMTEYHETLHITPSMLETHQNDMNKVESLFDGRIRDNFFRIVDIF